MKEFNHRRLDYTSPMVNEPFLLIPRDDCLAKIQTTLAKGTNGVYNPSTISNGIIVNDPGIGRSIDYLACRVHPCRWIPGEVGLCVLIDCALDIYVVYEADSKCSDQWG